MSDFTVVVVVVAMPLTIVFFVVGGFHCLHVDEKIRLRGVLWMAAGMVTQLVMCILLGNTSVAAVHAAGITFLLWIWWTRGGGDGLKRRLKTWSQSLWPTPLPKTV